MSEKPIQDLNDGKSWSEMDLFDPRNSLAYGQPIEGGGGLPLWVRYSRGS
jgi:hypothetical protein